MATTLSNAASSATLTQQSGTTTTTTNLLAQKSHLPNPFELSDNQILDKVYLTHITDDQVCDTNVLYNLVSIIIAGSSSQISGTIALRSAESRVAGTSFKPEFPTLKLISSQMIATRGAVQCAHQTTMWILQHLRSYSWEAKVLIALAAFSLEHGNFVHLFQIPTTDQLGNSLKQLNQVQTRKFPSEIGELAQFVVEVLQKIRQWATWAAAGYDTDEVHALTDALQEIPVVVYWSIASLVASTGNLIGVSEYLLSEFRDRLALNFKKFEGHLLTCKQEIEGIDDRKSRQNALIKIKDGVEFLKLLLYRTGYQNPIIYDGSTKKSMGIEVFKQKYVLLFISGLDHIGDEILLLKSIYDRLQENPKEIIKGEFKKEDFKILWIPMVDDWNENNTKGKFNALKNDMKWYVVDYVSTGFELPGYGIIKEKLKYEGNPIVPVYNPQGQTVNDNALHIIFEWGIDAFPFRPQDGEELTKKWKWLWELLKHPRVKLGLQALGDKYIFIYGGTNTKWIQDFTLSIQKLKRHEAIKRADVMIEHYQLGRDDPNSVPYFWMGVEGKKPKKKHNDAADCSIQTIVKSLLCLKQDPFGWVILSKGSNIKLLGHGEPVHHTVAEFDMWKEKVFEKEGFDIAFKEYYDIKLRELSSGQACAYIVDNTPCGSNVIATITCPNPSCGRVMEVSSVNYKCCHRDVPNICSF